jgi:hypothetical protein
VLLAVGFGLALTVRVGVGEEEADAATGALDVSPAG